MAYEEQLQSSWLSSDGDLLNLTWNDTSKRNQIKSGPIMEWDDAAWVLSATFIIFNMQTGFGMLESGIVSIKNEVNIMMKNVVDVVLGGLTYWAFGYSLSYGESEYSNPFISFGSYFVGEDTISDNMGNIFVNFLFQLSFATTATTIVSGAMAERANFHAYCLFSLVNTIVYCIPAGWLWNANGFLKQLGVVDIAGSGGVHLVGGSSAIVAAYMLGPRLGRWDNVDVAPPMGSPTNALVGLFMLWWGWLAFNAGSTFGVTGNQWRYAAKATVTTMISSFGGGIVSLVMSFFTFDGKIDVLACVNGVLGALVGITAGCPIVTIWEAMFIGMVGGFLANITDPLMVWLRVDDAVGATCVHGFGGAWGMIAVGIFAQKDEHVGYTEYNGILHGGGLYLFGVQLLTVVVLIIWSMVVTFILLFVINKIIPIRMTEHEELLGADFFEHDIRHPGVGVSRAVSVLKNYDDEIDTTIVPTTMNKGHEIFLEQHYGKREPTKNAIHEFIDETTQK